MAIPIKFQFNSYSNDGNYNSIPMSIPIPELDLEINSNSGAELTPALADIDLHQLLSFFSSSDISAEQRFPPHNRTLEVGELLECSWSPRQLHIPVRTGGIFYFPWHRHQIEGTDTF